MRESSDAMRSMTGFGKGSSAAPDGTLFTVELSSVNRKQLEIRLSLPAEFTAWEPEARKRIAEVITRGAVQVRVNAANGAAALADLDRARLDALIGLCIEERRKHGLPPEFDIAGLLALPGVFGNAGVRDAEAALPALNAALEQALAGFAAMRETEGAALRNELAGRLAGLRGLLAAIEPDTAGLAEAAKTKLLARLAAEKLPVDTNDERLLKEVLFYADKSDVTEEIARLKSHFEQFDRFLAASDEPAGRSMDFLIQEMFREITTLGNKAGSGDVSRRVVAFKAELEKMREQVQNVE